jgi:hypothetical protein
MKIGDVVSTRSIVRAFKNEVVSGTESYKAPSGEQFVFLLLGTDALAALRDLGWQPFPPPPTRSETT